MKAKIERWYAMGLWSDLMVHQAVKKELLSEAEAAKILG